MVRVYISNVSNLPDPKENLRVMEGLPEERKNIILRFVREQNRRQNLAAGLLLKYVLEQHEIDISNISYGPHGKPELPDFYFNLSHSHDYVVCAVSDKPVGCDIEKIGKSRKNVRKPVNDIRCHQAVGAVRFCSGIARHGMRKDAKLSGTEG